MDLSGLKWPLILMLVAVLVFLVSTPGIDFMFNQFSADPGDDALRARRYEEALSRLGGFCILSLRLEKGRMILEYALEHYPDGANAYFNKYRLYRIYRKLGRMETAVKILDTLLDENAHAKDHRVPSNDVLELERNKLIELYDMEQEQ